MSLDPPRHPPGAAELADDSPSASGYYELRAAWRERLARENDTTTEER